MALALVLRPSKEPPLELCEPGPFAGATAGGALAGATLVLAPVDVAPLDAFDGLLDGLLALPCAGGSVGGESLPFWGASFVVAVESDDPWLPGFSEPDPEPEPPLPDSPLPESPEPEPASSSAPSSSPLSGEL